MKKNLFILTLILALPFGFVSCGSDDDDNEEWRLLNQEAYEEIVANPEYHEVTTPGGPTGTYVKVLQSGEGTVKPLESSVVRVYYKGYYYEETVFDKGTFASNNELVGIRKINTLATSSHPYVRRGLSTALQNMVVGDKWEIVVPYYLGYGINTLSGSNTPYTAFRLCGADGNPVSSSEFTHSIPGYSTLYYEVELLAIDEL